MPASRPIWAFSRFSRLLGVGLSALLLVSIPVVLVDSLAYGNWVFVPLKIVLYNVFPSQGGGGPELYGTEPIHFYILNLLLNFNIVFPLALLSIPLLLLTHRFSKSAGLRLGCQVRLANQTSATRLLLIRLLPVYLWLVILSRQPHKEERFMFPIYTLICFNAAVSMALFRGWMEDIFVRVTSSPYRLGRTALFSNVTRTIIVVAASISISRILALQYYYHAPLDLMFYFQYHELPIRAIQSHPADYRHMKLNSSLPILEAIEKSEFTLDLSPLKKDNLSLCLGDSWYWFPTHFLVPDPIRVELVQSDFKGILPSKFAQPSQQDQAGMGRWIWKREGTRLEGGKFNSINREETDRYVDVKTCDYLIRLDYPDRQESSKSQSLKLKGEGWEVRKCFRMLDPIKTTNVLLRTLWLPLSWWTDQQRPDQQRLIWFGDMCLYQNKNKANI